jgi:hypothetical protein
LKNQAWPDQALNSSLKEQVKGINDWVPFTFSFGDFCGKLEISIHYLFRKNRFYNILVSGLKLSKRQLGTIKQIRWIK